MTGLALAVLLSATSADTSGLGLYRAACANCHGADGTGAPPGHVGFDTPLPDFTDCSFASREADADWGTVVHGGGPVRGFARMMPAFRDALSEEQITRVLSYVRTLCTDASWPRGELNMPRALLTEKAYPEDESVLSTSIERGDAASVVSSFIYERRIGSRGQLEVIVPFGAQRRAGTWSGGLLGDVVLGYKRTVFHSLTHGAIVSLAGEVKLPTGDRDAGLGSGTYVFESFLSAGKLLGDASFVQAQAGFEFPANRDRAESETFLRGVIGTTITSGRYGRAWTPMLEVSGGRELEDGAGFSWDLAPQMQISLNTRQHLLFNAGVVLPLTHREARRAGVVFYFLWDWFDGGLRDGW